MTQAMRHTPLTNLSEEELLREPRRTYDPLITSDLEVELAARLADLTDADKEAEEWVLAAGECSLDDVTALCKAVDDTGFEADDAAALITLLHKHDLKFPDQLKELFAKIEELVAAAGAFQY